MRLQRGGTSVPATAAGPGGWGAPPGGDRSWKRPVQRADQAKPGGPREKSAFDPRCVKKPLEAELGTRG